MEWLDRQIDKILDAWEIAGVEEVEVYSDGNNGYIMEYGERVKEFESGREAISFYNNRIKDLLETEPVSVIGSAGKSSKEKLGNADGYAAFRESEWAVDIFDAAANYAPIAEAKTRKDLTAATAIEVSGTEAEIEEQLGNYFRKIDEIYDTDPRERAEQYLINSVSGAITQAVIGSETSYTDEIDREYITQIIDEFED
jgi:hypothetical protein